MNFIKALIADIYVLKMYLFINIELSLFVNMLVRIWKKHAIASMTQLNRLAYDAVRQKKVTIQNVKEVLERGVGASSNQSQNQVRSCTEIILWWIPEECISTCTLSL